ncbi:MAG: hypothetical protein VXV85_07840 [Candidatus Thermoplasmatota archaeon]|nr:hypothetical protein [Candidatus Thermoplasmatota archaeon]
MAYGEREREREREGGAIIITIIVTKNYVLLSLIYTTSLNDRK